MANPSLNKKESVEPVTPGKQQEEISLKGTFVSVMLLGAFIALTWLGVSILYISRN